MLASRRGALYQKVMLFGFLVLPTVFLLVVFNVFMEATIFDTDGHLFVSGWRQLIAAATVNWSDALTGQYRFGATNGPSYYPIIQPWLYLVYVGYVVYSSVGTLRMIVR